MKRGRVERVVASLVCESDATDELFLSGEKQWIGRSSQGLRCLQTQNKCSRNQLELEFDEQAVAVKVCGRQGKNPTFFRKENRLDWSKVDDTTVLVDGDVLRFPQDVDVRVKIVGKRKINYGKQKMILPECVYGKKCKKLGNPKHMSKYNHSEHPLQK